MRALVSDFATNAVARPVIERGDHEDEIDRQVIYDLGSSVPGLKDGIYEHVRAHKEPVLWLADTFARAYGAGGAWLRMLDEVLACDRRV
jgi:hypothetical protein